MTYGEIAPLVITKKNMIAYGKDPDGNLLAEKNWMLACLFMDGANKKIFGYLLKSMSNNHALGTEKHPEDVKTALQVMMWFQEGAQKNQRQEKVQEGAGRVSGLVFCANNKRQDEEEGLVF